MRDMSVKRLIPIAAISMALLVPAGSASAEVKPHPHRQGTTYWSDFDGDITVIRRTGKKVQIGKIGWVDDWTVTCAAGKIHGTRVTLTKTADNWYGPLRFRTRVGAGAGWPGMTKGWRGPVLEWPGYSTQLDDYRPKVLNDARSKKTARSLFKQCVSRIR
jgi:hypothetical protein